MEKIPNKYPENEEEKKNMQAPHCANKGPKQIQLQVGKDYYYCGCGLSKNQPFCDGSHKGTPYAPTKFTAQKAQNYLCMCRRSKNTPFCDGSHQGLDF